MFTFLIVAISLGSHPASANKVKTGQKPTVLDFEADVIEGQKKAPELFLQLDVQKPDLSSILYGRKNFNDFHQADTGKRPMLSQPGKLGK